ncbi:tetratricopeptide repeat-containing sulfotransferase family protein [Thalassomonas actiniarum]|uniref:Sulfotransferase n=1 Tax=Thalassomonas actiniarum TaxID=485447 RepID=A0AAF0C4B2_9GAMM|nr:tetratricopeptide repeat-containing sulfotransferase family protein [Thalassomonas actiniarum]WDE02097.1 sulfotransferase [Thalassomonas actiniarum]
MSQHEKRTKEILIAVQHAHEMLMHNAFEPALQQGQEILKVFPAEPNALFIMGCALRGLGRLDEAKTTLQTLVRQTQKFSLAYQELAFTLHELKQTKPAIAALQKAVAFNEKLPQSWQLLSKLLLLAGDSHSAAQAHHKYLRFSTKYPQLGLALQAFIEGKLPLCERICRAHLKTQPTDVNAMRLLAEVAIKLGIFADAEHLLERCLALAPDYHLARLNYAHVLNKREKSQQALEQINLLEQAQSGTAPQRIEKAAILVRLGQFSAAIDLYDELIVQFPEQAGLYTSRGHALKTIGKYDAAVASYRQAIASLPDCGEAYWSLANLKTYTFEQAEIQAMQHELSNTALASADLINMCFALGKAFEDREEFAQSFNFYKQGNDLKQKSEHYDACETSALVDRTIGVCDQALFEQKNSQGCNKSDVIFIVGLPRSGSTLLEQILASHSMVDGTKELPDIIAMVRKLGGRSKREQRSKYPEIIADLSGQQRKALGEEYLSKTQVHRGSASFFIDKMPNNFAHIGLIKLILPQAKIIDARRDPMSTCFSCFKQLFSSGQAFSYGLENIGRYYLDYIRLMEYWHKVMPGEVLTVNYEDVVNDFERQVRQILAYCDLPFEQSCLEFYNNKRAVNTASSEQVRQPIYQTSLNAWANFDDELTTLKKVLNPLLNNKFN